MIEAVEQLLRELYEGEVRSVKWETGEHQGRDVHLSARNVLREERPSDSQRQTAGQAPRENRLSHNTQVAGYYRGSQSGEVFSPPRDGHSAGQHGSAQRDIKNDSDPRAAKRENQTPIVMSNSAITSSQTREALRGIPNIIVSTCITPHFQPGSLRIGRALPPASNSQSESYSSSTANNEYPLNSARSDIPSARSDIPSARSDSTISYPTPRATPRTFDMVPFSIFKTSKLDKNCKSLSSNRF